MTVLGRIRGSVFLAMFLIVACNSHDPGGPTIPSPFDPMEEARRDYQEACTQLGRDCDTDSECPPPLRCFDDACAEPPAMVGEGGNDVPTALFYADEGESAYYLEIVDTDSERRRGLMYRPWMLDDWGMIFIYDHSFLQSFWMRNTYIPLDMVFINPHGVVVGVVENARPLNDNRLTVSTPSQYVIELNAGQAALRGIEEGVICEFLNFPEGMLTIPE